MSKLNLRPLHDFVVIEQQAAKTVAKYGIIIPDNAAEKPLIGQVIVTGRGKVTEKNTRLSLDVKPNDKVLFTKGSGCEITLEGTKYLIMREENILGVLNN